jgi:hypothetical protein
MSFDVSLPLPVFLKPCHVSGCNSRGLAVGRQNKSELRIGSIKDGQVTPFIPLADPGVGSAEEIGVDDEGNVFAGFTASGKRALRKFVKN